MTKLNQLIAVLSGAKKKTSASLSELYKKVQKTALFSGSSRTYAPDIEEGYVYPSEYQKVTLIANDCIEEFVRAAEEYYDLAFSQDMANTLAKADVVVGGEKILSEVPVTHLLFLEKQLVDVRTFITKLPTLSIDKDWHYDAVKRFYVTSEKQTVKTKKITDYVVVVPPTKEHRAEVRETSKDINEGVWSLVEYSGGLSEEEIKKLLKKVDSLIEAVVLAREEANSINVQIYKPSKAIFGYIFG